MALHLLLISRFGAFSLQGQETRQSLQITLIQAVTRAEEKTATDEVQTPSLAVPRRNETLSSPSQSAKHAVTPIRPSQPVEATKERRGGASAAAKAEKAMTDPQQGSAPPKNPTGIPLPGLNGPARRVDIEFETLLGLDKKQAGRVRHQYVSQDGRYYNVIASPVAEEARPESSSAGDWTLEISGNIGEQGLSPVFYSVRGEIPERLSALKYLGGKADRRAGARNGRMRDGLLDRQSLLYQFMFQPPSPLGGKIWLSDGRTHALYRYSMALNEAQADIALAGVKTVRIVVVPENGGEGSEQLDLWLVPDMRYLPVMARYVDERGEITELRATKLDFVE